MVTYMTLDEANAKINTLYHDLDSFDDAASLAKTLTEDTGHLFIPIDRGGSHWPQFGVIMPPRIGEPVSISFNGDRYPCGHIASISKTMKVITTTDGRTFYRRRLSAAWINDGTWTLIAGHVSTLNESF